MTANRYEKNLGRYTFGEVLGSQQKVLRFAIHFPSLPHHMQPPPLSISAPDRTFNIIDEPTLVYPNEMSFAGDETVLELGSGS